MLSKKVITEADWCFLTHHYELKGSPICFCKVEGLRIPEIYTCNPCRMKRLMDYENCKITISRKVYAKASEDDYEVEAIEAHRKKDNGIFEFLIKWTGYNERTWEPMGNILVTSLIPYMQNYPNEFANELECLRAEISEELHATATESTKHPTLDPLSNKRKRKGKSRDDDNYVEPLLSRKAKRVQETELHDDTPEVRTKSTRSRRRDRATNISIEISPNTTVKEIGLEILNRMYIPPLYQKLTFNDVVLDNENATMKDLSIFSGAVIDLDVFDGSTKSFDVHNPNHESIKEIGFAGTNLTGNFSQDIIKSSDEVHVDEVKVIDLTLFGEYRESADDVFWVCSNCTLHNEISSLQCEACFDNRQSS